MVCNWFGHILSLARPARGESSIAHRAPPSIPLRLSHLLSPHGCTGQLAELLQGRRVKPLKGNYFIDTIRDDILFDILPPLHPPPHPSLTSSRHPASQLLPGEHWICVNVCRLAGASLFSHFLLVFTLPTESIGSFFFFTEKPLIFWPNFNHNLNIPIEINSNMYLWFQVSCLYLVFSIHSAMPALVSLHPCQVYLEWIDCRCYLGFRQRPEASVCVCLCERARETVSERVNDWHQTRVLHSGGSVGATQPVWQVIISVSCSGMTATSSETKHTTHTNSFPWVTEECLSKPIDWAINWGPTGNPLQSICPLLHGSRNATMAVALN